MAFCPVCRSEYRSEFTHCKSCGDIALVDKLPELLELEADELPSSQPVGFTEKAGSTRAIEVDGRTIDPWKMFDLPVAQNVKMLLAESNIASAIVPVEDMLFPDGRPRFEVRVKSAEREKSESLLLAHWQESVENEGVASGNAGDIETCPACGAHVPLDVEECPECELVLGSGKERSV